MLYKYGMRLRGFSIGCQPMNGFVRREDDPTDIYHDIIVYDRLLTEKECEQYALDDLNPTRGYRKASEVIDEFVERFKRRFFFMMATKMESPIYQCTGKEIEKLAAEMRQEVEKDEK